MTAVQCGFAQSFEILIFTFLSKVFCDDCDTLVQHVLRERGLNPHDCKVLCGFDGGQGILKIGFTVSESAVPEKTNVRSKYSQVIILILLQI